MRKVSGRPGGEGETRERRRKRLLNLEVRYRALGRLNLAKELRRQRLELPVGGVWPEEERALIAHCGGWHVVEGVPWTCPKCGAVVGQRGGPGEKREPQEDTPGATTMTVGSRSNGTSEDQKDSRLDANESRSRLTRAR